jgi:hypothetical protein
MELNSQNDHEDQSTSKNTSTLTPGEKFWLELKVMPYSNDRVGQAEVINFSRTLKKRTELTNDETTR